MEKSYFRSFVFKTLFQAEDGIRDVERSRGLGDVYKRQSYFRYFVFKTLFQALYLEIKPLKSTMGI